MRFLLFFVIAFVALSIVVANDQRTYQARLFLTEKKVKREVLFRSAASNSISNEKNARTFNFNQVNGGNFKQISLAGLLQGV